MKNWPHQDKAKDDIRQARLKGLSRVLVAAPCGAGKSRVMEQLAIEEAAAGGSVKIYLHRTLLLEQMIEGFKSRGIEFGVQSRGYEPEFGKKIQVCMTHSVVSRAINRGDWDLGTQSLILVDEAHQQKGEHMIAILGGAKDGMAQIDGHLDSGAFVVGFSATPVGCGDIYQEIIPCASYKECRSVNAHSLVKVYSPSEIDCAGLSRNTDGEFSGVQLHERATKIVGDVFDHWKIFNPDAKPAILFAPSVQSSMWFAQQWVAEGVPVAHMDGSICLLPRRDETGRLYLEQYETTKEIRQEVLSMSKSGEIACLMNRFVLREAVDMPWLYHGIEATVFGSIATYLQSVGRVQRYFPGYECKIWQSHGGSYWRHGSPNQNRVWHISDTNRSLEKQRREKIRTSSEPEAAEGICCPKCHGWRSRGPKCPHCGHSHVRSLRVVRQLDGELKLMRGVVNKPRKKQNDTADGIWIASLYRAASVGQPVSSAVAQWAARCNDQGIKPSVQDLKFQPPDQSSSDWHRLVSKVYPWTVRKKTKKK